MVTVSKGERTQELFSDVQVAAFVANGWEVLKTSETKGAKAAEKPKGGKGAKAAEKLEPVNEPEQESDEEANG